RIRLAALKLSRHYVSLRYHGSNKK
ncbi:MAG: hypothetical protein QOF32_998, partial [Gammaproteobacteria bacterium]|nr:hypothetical protein [Gammaproteobacteria bacterium]